MFNLTRGERQVILFLLSVALIGLGINFLGKSCAKIKVRQNIYQDLGKVDLNQADKELLISVPGIGPKLAERIIDYRKQKASFRALEELKDIKGISEAKYEKIKESFYVK
jgi:competence ComEA-like helix-hairpin-helix protein